MTPSRNSNRPIPNSYWVVPGRFAAGEYPGDLDLSKAAHKVRSLIQAGINRFIDLTTEEDKLKPYADIATREARRLDIPIELAQHPILDESIPNTPADMTRILDAIDDGMSNGSIVYVHCWGGVGRTGTVVGCWLRRHGHSGRAALAQVNAWWREMTPAKIRRHGGSPERSEQKQYVLDWTERR